MDGFLKLPYQTHTKMVTRQKAVPLVKIDLSENNFLSKEESLYLYIYLRKNVNFFKEIDFTVLGELATKMHP